MDTILKRRFTRPGPLAANLDIKTYDVGSLFVCTVDGSGPNIPWGKLWVEYDIDLYIPQLSPFGALPYGGTVAGGGVFTAANPLGTIPVQNPLNAGFTVSAASVVNFTATGSYVVGFEEIGTVITGLGGPAVGGGAVAIQAFSDINGAATGATFYGVYKINSLPASLAFTTTATTITSSFLSVGQMPVGSE